MKYYLSCLQSESIKQMIDVDPEKRPNASSLLNMPHFSDKDMVRFSNFVALLKFISSSTGCNSC